MSITWLTVIYLMLNLVTVGCTSSDKTCERVDRLVDVFIEDEDSALNKEYNEAILSTTPKSGKWENDRSNIRLIGTITTTR